MTDESPQARARMAAAHDRYLEPPDDAPEFVGHCPVCDGETFNYEMDADERGTYASAEPCDTCATPCKCCEDTRIVGVFPRKIKGENGYCARCTDGWPWACDDCAAGEENEPCSKHDHLYEPDNDARAKDGAR